MIFYIEMCKSRLLKYRLTYQVLTYGRMDLEQQGQCTRAQCWRWSDVELLQVI